MCVDGSMGWAVIDGSAGGVNYVAFRWKPLESVSRVRRMGAM